ncbi:sacsin N-terminal ATP-binding-like domain-containing protein [Paenibacillus sp. TAB 01]|uniref:sacsin N-terminal ATP-binding-like domain-containing protein n=1 Tax=Paenibacillus sp. TAB 01 TaxID=3368988 RepID=UPI00375263D8
MEEKKFVQDLYDDKTKNDSNSKSLARLLNVLTKTVFGDANRFVFELIQNADDSPKDKGRRDVEIEFRLINNNLIFSHNGKHFTKEDVSGISDVGSGDSGKTKDLEKTGYKGIGFKSIFGTCDKVYILSNKFTFKFDKHYDVWKNTQEYPWQIIPIWFEETDLESELRAELNKSKVTTIISLSDREKVKNEILHVLEDPRVMLFLRHVSQITFFDMNKKLLEISCKQVGDDSREIFVSGQMRSKWIYKEFVVPVDEETKEKVKLLDAAVCPDKLKFSSHTKITFAASVFNDEIQEISDALFYSYLPTKARSGFSFLVNGDFITNAERTQILENDWNNFIFKQLAICKIKWISELVENTKFKYEFTKLIKTHYTPVGSSELKQSYNDGLDVAIAKTPFIPKQDKAGLLKVNESILDSTGYCEEFNPSIVTNHYNNNYEVAACKIIYPNRLSALGAKKIEIKDLCEIFKTAAFIELCNSNLEFNIKLVQFLYNKDSHKQKFDWAKTLKTAAFLLSDSNNLKSPENVYFPIFEGEKEINNIIGLICINERLYESVKSNKQLLDWLKMLGVREPSDIEIIRKSIIEMIKTNSINTNNAIQIGKFVFKVYQQGRLDDNDYKSLRALKLVTTKGALELPSECYLSDFYGPELKIEEILPEGKYVTGKYVEKESEINKWRLMLIKLGVKEKIGIRIEPIIERTSMINKYPSVRSYFEFIDNDGSFYDSITKPYINNGQHGLQNAVIIDYLEHSKNYNFSISYWKMICRSWETIRSNCEKTTYYTRINNKPVISYFQYYVKNHPSIPANNNQCYKSTEIYSENLRNIIKDYYPAVHESISFNKEQEEFLGIKTQVTIQDCLCLLKKIEDSQVDRNTLKQIEAIYKQLISNKPVYDTEHNINDMKLLATDDTFHYTSLLYFFDVEGQLPPTNSKYFIKVSDSLKDKDILLNFFDIQIIRNDDLQLNVTDKCHDFELISELHKKAKYFATLLSNVKAEDPMETLIRFKEKLTKVSFYKARSLSLSFANKTGIEIYNQNVDSWYDTDSNSLYYVGQYNNPLTLYNLSSSLSSLFEMEGKDREVGLIIQLSSTEIESWLNSKGYVVIQYEPSKIEEFKYDDIVIEDLDYFADIDPQLEEDSDFETSIEVVEDDEYFIENTSSGNNHKPNKLDHYIREKNSGIYSTSNIEEDDRLEEQHNYEHSTSSVTFTDNFNLSSQKKRLISFVSSNPIESSLLGVEYERKLQYQLLARKIVFEYEEKAGRRAIQPFEMEEAYDVISFSGEAEEISRYIKVFGFIGEWNNYEVVLSHSQMKKAKDLVDKFWLYVVEFVADEQHVRINRIQDPYNKITNYVLDYGWRAIAEINNPLDKLIVGTKINHFVHGLGVIKGEINRGKLKLLIVEFESGEKRIPINITQMDILED